MIKTPGNMTKYLMLLVVIFLIYQKCFTQINYIIAGDTISNNIIYSNIPDYNVQHNYSFNIDINADNVNDFSFSANYFYDYTFDTYYSSITSLNNNSVNVINLDPKIVNEGDTIGNNCIWSETNNNLCYRYCIHTPYSVTSSGIWLNMPNKYIGLKLVTDSGSLYGWVLVSVGYGNILVQSYAVQKSITLSNNILNKSNNEIFPNPITNDIFIKVIGDKTLVEIYNLNGEIIFKDSFNKSKIIDLSGFAKGVYVIHLTTDQETITKKIIKE